MHFEPNHIYHVYNRGNNKIPIFFRPDNYLFFLRKVKNEWLPYCDVCCYCLMPNHFHFMLMAKPAGCESIFLKDQLSHLQKLSKVIGKTLSSYTQAINIQNNTTGNLFQKKTKAKSLTDVAMKDTIYSNRDYSVNCFHYIHYNPLEALLVNDLRDWPYSSWPDYYGFRNGDLCNKELTMQITGLASNDLHHLKSIIPEEKITELIW